MVAKNDIYNSNGKWKEWLSSPSIPGTLKSNEALIINFLKDFDLGINTSKSATNGQRSPIRLMALKSRLTFFALKFPKKDFKTLTKTQISQLFKDMREGVIKTRHGKAYTSTGSYVKDWKCFWNWGIKAGKIPKAKKDINEDLSRTDEKPSWVYLNEEQFKKFANRCSPDYRPLVWLFLDAGCRVTEGFSIKVSDFSDDYTKLTIREETSKNKYGRTIHLKICSALIKDYVKFYNLEPDDFLIQKKPAAFNKYLKENCIKIFGDGVSHPKAKGKFSEFSIYSIRHIASCYWLQRYKSHSSLMYRMGWSSERFVRYYSEFLGQNDDITDDDMLVEEDRNKVQKLEDKIKTQDKRINIIEKSSLKILEVIVASVEQKNPKLIRELMKAIKP